jgi:hypothetical protein
MPQDRDTGAAGDSFGRECGRRIANALGANLVSGNSNEAVLNGRRVVIKCAAVLNTKVGVLYGMLDRLDEVIGAFQREDGAFDIISLPASVYRQHMTDTRSQGPSAGEVGIVNRSVFLTEGQQIAVVTTTTAF